MTSQYYQIRNNTEQNIKQVINHILEM